MELDELSGRTTGRLGYSRRTKPEYPAASGRRDHETFGSGPTRQSDDRDSEPDYLLRPTMHGPVGTLLIIAHSFFSTGHRLSVGSFAIQRTMLQSHIALKETLRLNQ